MSGDRPFMCNVSNDKWGAGGGGSGQKDLYHLMMWEAGLQKIFPSHQRISHSHAFLPRVQHAALIYAESWTSLQQNGSVVLP